MKKATNLPQRLHNPFKFKSPKEPKTLAVWIEEGGSMIGESECPTGTELPQVDLGKCSLFSATDINDVQRKYSDFTLLGTLAGGKVMVIKTLGYK